MNAIVLGAGGFIGTHLVKRLREEGYYVRGVDLKYPQWTDTEANEFIIGDLRSPDVVNTVLAGGWDEVYQLAADMGGAEYIFTGKNDNEILLNNSLINLYVGEAACRHKIKKLFFSSSACVYPVKNQQKASKIDTRESSAIPADPDSAYGWEKLTGEAIFMEYGNKIDIRIARYHNIFGPLGTYEGVRAKAPAALCRKTILAEDGGSIEILGDGQQTRSFLYIDHCILATRKLMEHESFHGPVNIGSEEMVSIAKLAWMIIDISGKDLILKHKIKDAPVGVLARNSDNTLFEKHIGWSPDYPLDKGLDQTYGWIKLVMDKRGYISERNPDTDEVRTRMFRSTSSD